MLDDIQPVSSTPNNRTADLFNNFDILVISNRQPYRHDIDEIRDTPTVSSPAGGLTASLDPVMQEVGGTWIAWGDGDLDFDVTDDDDRIEIPPDNPSYTLQRVRLSEADVRDYYYGYSNQVLWPLCHSTISKINCAPKFWKRYRSVNEKFAEFAARQSNRSIVWFHDYHLALAPRMTRSRLGDHNHLIHFWHIPWPSWDVFRICEQKAELLDGLLGNDLLGFHVPRYAYNFLECVEACLDDATVDWHSREVSYHGNITDIAAIPMGIPFDEIAMAAGSDTANRFWQSYRNEHGISESDRIAIGIDRLDYTKGILERLHALEWLFEQRPRWRQEITYIQKGSESRSAIPEYQRIQRQIEEEITRINRRFSTNKWQPIVFDTNCYSRTELIGLYGNADIAIVSPIRDGMNIVAQEYAAAQTDCDGVLVLSEQTGAHDLLGDHVVSISPHDTTSFGQAIEKALKMPSFKRVKRMQAIRRKIAENDLQAWLEANLQSALPLEPQKERQLKTEVP